jgi:hypothetical protein
LFVLVALIALATQRAFDAEQQIFIDQHQITTVTCVTMVMCGHVSTLALLYATRGHAASDLRFCMRRGENGACDAEPVFSRSHMMISRHECVMLLLLLLLLTLDRRHWIRNHHRRQWVSCGVGGALWQPHHRIECG